MVQFNDRALTEAVDETAAVRAVREEHATTGLAAGERKARAWSIVQTVVLIAGVGVLAALLVSMVQMIGGAWSASASTFVIAGLMVLPLAVARVIALIRTPRRLAVVEHRLSRFAADNALQYRGVESRVTRFTPYFGRSGTAAMIISGRTPRAFEVGVFSYDSGTGRARMPHSAQYVMLQLARPLTDAEQIRLTAFIGEWSMHPQDGSVFLSMDRALGSENPLLWEWIADLLDLLNAIEQGDPDPVAMSDHGRMQRRMALYERPKAGRTFAIGCLLPLVYGIALAAVSGIVGW